ncbi:MAG: diaminopimelate epimerase [Gammaproteobacteria bacterium]
MKFYRYQSLGNDFILLDWLECEDSINPDWIRQNCDRRNGAGADGILVLQNKNHPRVRIFNADGSDGQSCFNGVRCAAYHLVSQRNFPQTFKLKMQRLINCEVIKNLITINVGKVSYKKPHQILIANKILSGHIVDVGNPHFVILEKIDLSWLQKYGHAIENHQDFPGRTNVEFVWRNANNYYALVYERGCGITKACGTGAAAIVQTLFHQNEITCNQKISIQMPGGVLQTYLDDNESVIQVAQAEIVN